MRRMHYFQSLFLCLAVAGFSASTAAQAPAQSHMPAAPSTIMRADPLRKTFMANPAYQMMAREVVTRPKNFNFGSFRTYYAESSQYDPLGDLTKEWLLKYAYIVQTEKDPVRRDKALRDFGEKLSQHLANIDAVMQALVLSQQDRRFGDPEFFEWLRYGLVNSVQKSGDGGSIFRAYDIVTIGEESALLNQMNVQVLETKSEESGGLYYNMHTVKDGIHPQSYTVFTDVTLPMRFLDRKRGAQGANFAIPRQ